MRQHILGVIFVACAMFSIGGITAPERALAQVTCPVADTAIAPTGDIQSLFSSGANSCTVADFSDRAYNGPRSASSARFRLFLPGNAPITGDYPVRVFARNASGTDLEITTIICAGATIDFPSTVFGDPDLAIGEITLPADSSCEFYVFWEDGDDDLSFSGGILSRNGDVYSITATTLAGGQFGGVAATGIGPAIDIQRNGVSFNDGDTDALGTLTAGVEETRTYTICNTGSVELTSVNAFVQNEQNLLTPAGSDPVTLVDTTDNLDLGNPRTMSVGKCIDVDATFTPTHATDFSFDLVLSNGSTTAETLTITVSAIDNTVSGTLSAPQTIARTQRIISNFMGRRASQIVGKEPDLTKRLSDGGDSSSANSPVSVTGEGTVNNQNLAFATSLRQVIGSTQVAKRKRIADTATRMALGAGRDGSQVGGSLKDGPVPETAMPRPGNKFGLWAEGTWAKVDNDTAESDFGLLYIGADYRFNSGLVVGVIAQFDKTDEEDDTNGFSIEGKGWMAGPYVVARLSSNLIFDARAAWGKSDNEVSPFNTYTDSFDGRRWLVRGRLTGDFAFGQLHIAPHVGVIYFEEEQKAYTDSNGYAIGAQTVELGRLTFGPKISTSFTRPDGTTIAPFVALQGIWDFKRTDQVNIDTGLAITGTDKVRARAEAGLSVRLPQGVAITGEGFYDGIGADGYNAYGGSLKVGVPF